MSVALSSTSDTENCAVGLFIGLNESFCKCELTLPMRHVNKCETYFVEPRRKRSRTEILGLEVLIGWPFNPSTGTKCCCHLSQMGDLARLGLESRIQLTVCLIVCFFAPQIGRVDGLTRPDRLYHQNGHCSLRG